MSTLNIRIPDSYRTMAEKISKADNTSIGRFISSAIGEKVAVKTSV